MLFSFKRVPILLKNGKIPNEPPLSNKIRIRTYTPFNETTESDTLGDATIATAEKGKLIVDSCVARIVEYMKDEFGC